MTSPGTRITLLGRLSIDRDGVPCAPAFTGRRAELVFAYLAAEHGRDVSRDELADALWPVELPDAWAAALRGVVTDVRRTIEAAGLDARELLERGRDGYRLRLPADVVVDLDEARESLAAARAGLADDAPHAAERAVHAAEVAALPFLPRHEGAWADGIRAELGSIRAEALELAARSHERAGDARAAAAAAARLVEAEPYSEAAHRLRIEVLGAGGDRVGALRAYEECRALLADDLGVEPSAETQAALQLALAPPAAAAPQAQAQSAAPQAAQLAGYSVLVVEDHDFQRRTALALLTRLGVGTLAEARDGLEALGLLARSPPPDVIVCDIDMPGMDGVEFIRHVAERRLASAVLIASGMDRSVLQAVEAVGAGYGLQVLGAVEKPLTARRLSELLASYRRPPPSHDPADQPPEAELRAALDAGQIGARFIPIVDLATGAVSGAQAVGAWRDGALVAAQPPSPSLAARFTDHLLATGCDELRELTPSAPDVELWIAIPDAALEDVSLADRLIAVARGCDRDARRIVCTIGPRALRGGAPAELDVLTRLRVKGFGVCLEDYRGGGAHMTADALRRIPLTAIAIAPDVVCGAAADGGRTAALEDALGVAHELGLTAVARGCDAAEDFELLLQLGCRYAQGGYIAAALAGPQLAEWAASWQAPFSADGPA